MDQEFLNLYIEKMSKRLDDSYKKDLIIETQFELAQRLIAKLNAELAEKTEMVDNLQKQLEKYAKRAIKSKAVDTSDCF